jgi:7,8-dihydro-6-hydroxymethylpterin-pyrophosphokinase
LSKKAYLHFCAATAEALDAALAAFAPARVSARYETPDGMLVCAAELETEEFPRQLHARIKRALAAAPRRAALTITMLVFGRFVIATPEFVVPHPDLQGNRELLDPLAEIAPELRHPALKRTLRELAAAAPDKPLRKATMENS